MLLQTLFVSDQFIHIYPNRFVQYPTGLLGVWFCRIQSLIVKVFLVWQSRVRFRTVPFSTLIAVRVRFSNQPFLCFPFSVLYSVLSDNHHFCRRLSYLWALQAHSFRRLSYPWALQAHFCCGLSWNSQIRFDINWWLSAALSLHDRCGMIGTGEAWWNIHLTVGQWSLYRSFVR